MHPLFAGIPFAFLVASTPVHAAECREILESDVKIAAMRSYADILALAARNGRMYRPEAIDRGSKRHFEEMKARLSGAGYTIVPAGDKTLCRRGTAVASR
jgi:hypothetical protein